MGGESDLVRWVARWVTSQPTRTWNNDWGPTVQMYGLISAGRTFGLADAVDYARAWLRERVAAGERYVPPSEPADWNAYYRGLEMMVHSYCGSWGCNLVAPALDEHGDEFAGLRRRIRDYIVVQAERTTERGLKHGGGRETYWLDTLYFSVPGLAYEAARSGDDDDFTEGARQLSLHAARLRDARTGLFFHCWREQDDWRSDELWARGNGWVAIAAAEWLSLAPSTHPHRDQVVELLRTVCDALHPVQSDAGLWRTILDRTDAYEEVSASAMIAFAMARGYVLGLLDDRARAAAIRCAAALNSAVAADGAVIGVSGGTDPGDAAHYLGIPRGTYAWGTGAWLLAMAEVARLAG
jgi:rhamnogalacturonyl hydrolase YesR